MCLTKHGFFRVSLSKYLILFLRMHSRNLEKRAPIPHWPSQPLAHYTLLQEGKKKDNKQNTNKQKTQNNNNKMSISPLSSLFLRDSYSTAERTSQIERKTHQFSQSSSFPGRDHAAEWNYLATTVLGVVRNNVNWYSNCILLLCPFLSDNIWLY